MAAYIRRQPRSTRKSLNYCDYCHFNF